MTRARAAPDTTSCWFSAPRGPPPSTSARGSRAGRQAVGISRSVSMTESEPKGSDGSSRHHAGFHEDVEAGPVQEDEQRLTCSSRDHMRWCPVIVQFLFGGEGGSVPHRSCCYLYVTFTSQSGGKQRLQNQIEQFIAPNGINNTDDSQIAVILCDRFNQNIEKPIKEKLRKNKLSGHHVIVLSFSDENWFSDDIKWIATKTFTRKNVFSFIFYLQKQLNLIRVSAECCQPSVVSRPEEFKGTLTFVKSTTRPGDLTLQWEYSQPVDGVSLGYLHLERRSEGSREWETLTQNLPLNTVSHEVTGLETSFWHQFRLRRETAVGLSEPITSKWLSWDRQRLWLEWNSSYDVIRDVTFWLVFILFFPFALIILLIYGLWVMCWGD